MRHQIQYWRDGPHYISSSFPEIVVLMLSLGTWFWGEPVPNEGAQLPSLSKVIIAILVWFEKFQWRHCSTYHGLHCVLKSILVFLKHQVSQSSQASSFLITLWELSWHWRGSVREGWSTSTLNPKYLDLNPGCSIAIYVTSDKFFELYVTYFSHL